MNEIIIKNNELDRNRSLLDIIRKKDNHGNEVLFVSKDTLIRLKKIFEFKVLCLKLKDGVLNIESIILDQQVKIKDRTNRVSNSIKNRFTISKSYVATTRKGIVDRCKNFYGIIKEVVSENKLIVDISKEVNLQRELSLNRSSVPQNGIRIFNKPLRLKPDFCQKVNESTSVLMVVSREAKKSLLHSFRTLSEKANNLVLSEEAVKKELKFAPVQKPKKLVRTKSFGHASVILITILVLVSVLVLSYTITSLLIK